MNLTSNGILGFHWWFNWTKTDDELKSSDIFYPSETHKMKGWVDIFYVRIELKWKK